MVKAGDIFSIRTSKGNAYFQYVKRDALMGQLIRVFRGVYECAPDLNLLCEEETNFWIFFPVGSAVKDKVIDKVVNLSIPAHSKKIPLFRTGVRDTVTGKVKRWWFWDGDQEWMVGAISEEERKLPIRGIWNDTMLIERIEDGWLPENDDR